MMAMMAEALQKIDTPIGNPLEGLADYLMKLAYRGPDAKSKYSATEQTNYGDTAKNAAIAALDVI
jgi:hypothetical protein